MATCYARMTDGLTGDDLGRYWNHFRDSEFVPDAEPSRLDIHVKRQVVRMPETEHNGLPRQRRLSKHKLEIPRSFGFGRGSPYAVRCGDHRIGDR